MRLIVGLGNPGSEYANTRHNIGFMVLDKWAQDHGCGFARQSNYEVLKYRSVILLKPHTYMNLSGKAVNEAINKWNPEEILVIYDDLELPVANIRIRTGGGDGGHNGIKSLADYVPTDTLKRIRIGIGRSENSTARDYVLEPIPATETALYEDCIQLVSQFLDTYIRTDFSTMLDEFSKWKKSYSGKNEAGITSPKEEKRD
ncbi:MAG: aminoacyl-tRNA hydrolase [Candidatus Cloacimonetes bacterium HGW-Cloacimonetes-2]|jgi:PTH1 family peptidyl-tRNA hydrolase|nr:MAG: aminoacyl-tRNA hydrolase [Candidatus Cloacimonetes bacterium HGW-Cloacimonetes-2]